VPDLFDHAQKLVQDEQAREEHRPFNSCPGTLAPSDESLLEAFYTTTRERDAEVRFVAFQNQVRDWLRGQAWFILGRWSGPNRADRSEEVAQCVLIRVWQTWRKPGTRWRADKGSLRGWLSVLVRRSITDLHRFDDQFGALLFPQRSSTEEARPEATVAAPNETTEDDIALADELDRFLRELSEDDRNLLEMKMYANLTQGEIARRMEWTDSYVSRRLRELIGQLAVRLGLDSSEGPR
jgi:RNA polymerase sigma factor (sigma-70 family)